MKSLSLTELEKGPEKTSEEKISPSLLKWHVAYWETYARLFTLILNTSFEPFKNEVTDSEYEKNIGIVALKLLREVIKYAGLLATIRNHIQIIDAQLAQFTLDDSELVSQPEPELSIQSLLLGNIAIMWRRCWYSFAAAVHAYDNLVKKQAEIYQKRIFDHTQKIKYLQGTTAKILNARNAKAEKLREQIAALRRKIGDYKGLPGAAPSFWGMAGEDPQTKQPYPKEPNTFDFVVYLAAFLTEIAEEKRVQVARSESLGIHSWEEIFSKLDAWNGREKTEKSDILAQIDEDRKLTIAKERLVMTHGIENSSFTILNERLKGKEDKVYSYNYTAAAGSAPLSSVIEKLLDFHNYFVVQSTHGGSSHDSLLSIISELNIVMSSLRKYASEADKVTEQSRKSIDEYKATLQSLKVSRKREQEIIATLKGLARIFTPLITGESSVPKKISQTKLVERHNLDNQWSEVVSAMLKMEEKRYTWSEKIDYLNMVVSSAQEIPIGLSSMRAVFMRLLGKNISILQRAVEGMEKNSKFLRLRPKVDALKFCDLLAEWKREAKSMIIRIEGVGDLVITPFYKVQEAITQFNKLFKGWLFSSAIEKSYEKVKLDTQYLENHLKQSASGRSYSVSDIMKELSIFIEAINQEIFKKFKMGTLLKNTPSEEAKKIENILKIRSSLIEQQDKKYDEKSVELTSVYSEDSSYKNLVAVYKRIYKDSQYGVGLDEVINKRLIELLNATLGVQKQVFFLLLSVYEARGVINFEGEFHLYKKIILACQGKSLVEKRFNLIKIISEQSIALLRKNSPKKEPPDIFLAPLITVAEKLYILHDKMHEALLNSYETEMELSQLSCEIIKVKEKLQAGTSKTASFSPALSSSLPDLFKWWQDATYLAIKISKDELKKSHLDVELKHLRRDRIVMSREFKVINLKLWPSICQYVLPHLSFEKLAESILLRLGLKKASSTPPDPVAPKSKQKTSLLDTLDDKTVFELDYMEDVGSEILVECLKLGMGDNPVGKESITKLVLSKVQVFLQVWFDSALDIVRESLQTEIFKEMEKHVLSAAKRSVLNFVLEAPSYILMSPHKGTQSIHFYRFQDQPKRTSVWEASFVALQIIADEKQPFFGNIPHVAALQLKITGDQSRDMPFDKVLNQMAVTLKINIYLYQELTRDLALDKIDGEEIEDSKNIFKLNSIKPKQFGESDSAQSIYLYRDREGHFYPLLSTGDLIQKPEYILRLQKLPASVFSATPVELSSSRSSSSSSMSSSSQSFTLFSSSTASTTSDSSSSRASSSMSSI